MTVNLYENLAGYIDEFCWLIIDEYEEINVSVIYFLCMEIWNVLEEGSCIVNR